MSANMSSSSKSSPPMSAPRSMKSLTCYFWANGSCKWDEHECLYSHHHTGRISDAPKRREPGCPAVAGKNASKDRPIYQDWRAVHKNHQKEQNEILNRQLADIHNKAQVQDDAAKQTAYSTVHSTSFRGDAADHGESKLGMSGPVNHVAATSPGDQKEKLQQLLGMRQATPKSSAGRQPSGESVASGTKLLNRYNSQADIQHSLKTKDTVIAQMSREMDKLTVRLQAEHDELMQELYTIMQVIVNLPIEPSYCPSPDAISPPYGRPPTNSERLVLAAQNITRVMGTTSLVLNKINDAKAEISSRLEDLGEGYLVASGWSR